MIGFVMWILGFIIFVTLTARGSGKKTDDDNIGMFFVDRDSNDSDGEGGGDGGW